MITEPQPLAQKPKRQCCHWSSISTPLLPLQPSSSRQHNHIYRHRYGAVGMLRLQFVVSQSAEGTMSLSASLQKGRYPCQSAQGTVSSSASLHKGRYPRQPDCTRDGIPAHLILPVHTNPVHVMLIKYHQVKASVWISSLCQCYTN
jgi:hypothetical protein